ncbi:uncharacterized protein LOC123308989 isoform X2 [Coccinella septempunctata]|uniref:uncharacterized protein LOC123308989 isoform X2 n=1 Tax=Coccinella septempunctata TaxID=41139 RepID=UPI001D0781AA|nr:uncharacterized protein LOC123308989 isoform X2 [Coccinella septempunctata]
MATDGTIFTRTTPSPSVAVSVANPHRQKRMGPAPFASFEDLSDELESPDDTTASSVVRLPGIHEDLTPSSPGYIMSHTPELVYTGISLVGQVKTPVNPSTSFLEAIVAPASGSQLQAPNTPRIDISRASSSSHHDSKDSSPDREIIEGNVGSNRDQATAKLGVGFREDGTLDLRSSTEELDFQDQKEQEKKKSRSRPQSPSYLYDESYQNHTRKDSQCSEISLLAISGRTSRLSSIGSAGSAQSRISNASHLSVLSGGTELSRSPSPHKMLLETSFCGTKSPQSMSSVTIDKIGTKDSDDFEKILLSRKHDPTEAILAEGISVKKETRSASMKEVPQKPARRMEKRVQSVRSDIKIKVDTPSMTDANITPRPTKKIVSESGVEYIYIPLKGPLPLDFEENETTPTVKPPRRTTTTARVETNSSTKPKTKSNPTSSQPKPKENARMNDVSLTPRDIMQTAPPKIDEPKYIRIKLKPDHLYDDDDDSATNTSRDTQPEKIDLDEIKTDDSTTGTYDTGKSLTSTPSVSPKFSRHCVVRDFNMDSKTPSPSLSRKSSFASIFRSKEAITSPESPTIPGRRKNMITGILREASESLKDKGRTRSRSKSRERDRPLAVSNTVSSSESIDSRGKTKGLFSIFRTSKSDVRKTENEPDILPEKMIKVEFNFSNGQKKPDKLILEKPLEANSIRIPLHSPTHYENENHRFLKDIQTPSQESQDTVIEVIPPKKEEVISAPNPEITNKKNAEIQSRQSSTSSENVVFSTRVGSNNDIFTTKLPKDKRKDFSQSKNERPSQPDTQVKLETTLEIHHNSEQVDQEEKLRTEVSVETHKEPELKRTVSTTSFKEIEAQITMTTNTAKPRKPKSEQTLPTSQVCDEDKNESSESEKDSEASSVLARIPKPKNEMEVTSLLEPESKGLVVQDSFEDELPYVPTTLPQERSAALPIVPIKQRNTFEMKTCPIDRPRSTTPINPNSLEEYCEDLVSNVSHEKLAISIEKLKISLPRLDSSDKASKSPKKPVNTNWFDFAEKCSHTGRKSSGEADTPPPLPPKGIQKEWINFEEVPERRKLPKRIQTIPSRGHIDVPENVLHDHVVYNYVNPDECRCECHEKKEKKKEVEVKSVQEDEIPLLENETEEQKVVPSSRNSIKISEGISLFSESSVDLSVATEQHEDLPANGSLQKPFKIDLDVSSNRSSIVSLDEPHSSCSETPNAFSKPS